MLSVDASQAAQKLFHARLTMPVTPGPLTLLYPKWIPGEHMPTGPIQDNVGVKFSAGGQTIPWRRDDADMFTYHVTVPPGVNQLEIALDYTSPVSGERRLFRWRQRHRQADGHQLEPATALSRRLHHRPAHLPGIAEASGRMEIRHGVAAIGRTGRATPSRFSPPR